MNDNILNFTISFIAGAVFYFFFTYLPYYRKKKILEKTKNKIFHRLSSEVAQLIQEVFLQNKLTNQKALYCLYYETHLKDKNIIELKDFNKLDKKEKDLLLEKTITNLKHFQKFSSNSFKTIISNITTHSDISHIKLSNKEKIKIYEYLTTQIPKILFLCEKLFIYNEYLNEEEIYLINQLYDLKFMRVFIGKESVFYAYINQNFVLHLETCYEFYCLFIDIQNYILKEFTHREQLDLINQ